MRGIVREKCKVRDKEEKVQISSFLAVFLTVLVTRPQQRSAQGWGVRRPSQRQHGTDLADRQPALQETFK